MHEHPSTAGSSVDAGPAPVGAAAVGLAAVAMAAALWAGAATIAADLFRSGVHPLELTLARAAIAAVGLGLVALGRPRRHMPLHPMRLLAFGVTIALVTATYYFAIDRLAVAVAIVLQYTAPALVVMWTALYARRRPGTEVIAAVVAAIVGVALVSGIATGDLGRIDPVGVMMGLASAVCFAAYTLLSEDAGRAYGPVGAMFRAFGIAAIFWIVVQAARGFPSALFEADNVLKVVVVGIGGTLIPFMSYVWAIQRVRPERASIAATLEPVIAGVFAWVWLGQSLLPVQIAGGLLVIGAVMALQIQRREPVLAPEP